ncbi:protein KRI1 homolog isoform X2 [Hydra vulgaris]|uniref:Protein KRI1 homolog n=1 Tax=Hydra vulgaris TaxID=6087 RepID=A0ABM4C6I5_HYDVU
MAGFEDLFDGNSDEKITINKTYAKKYKKFKECQELDKLKQKYGDEILSSESSSEEEDDNAECVTPQIEQDFLNILGMIKAKDPKIYSNEVQFFNEKEENSEEKKKLTKKPLFLKDFERQRLLLKKEKAYLSDSDEDINDLEENQLTYNEEQKQIKDSFKNVDMEDDEELLKIREKSKDEKEKEDEEYKKWLNKEEEKQVKSNLLLDEYWKDGKIDEDEKFLRDYILKKQYIDKDNDRIPTYNEVVGELNSEQEDEDEKDLEKVEDFEKKFNFRFEEPDQDLIKRYPRTIKESVRCEDDKRKQKRKDREERKKKEKDKKIQELKRLKKLKRKEIIEKIEKLKEITGNNKVGFLEEELDGEFDAAKYDQLMKQVYDKEFYDVEEYEKPVLSDDDDLKEENWDEWTGAEKNEELHFEDPDFNMDADFVPTVKSKKKKKSKFEEALLRKKPVFNPDEKTFEQYFDEYYKLDFEDMIGDMPVRFKYRNVMANDFGLSTEEILKAEDRELNQWCSLKKTMQYNTEEEEKKYRQKYKKKARDVKKKQRLLPSLFDEKEESESVNHIEVIKPRNIKQLQKKKLGVWSKTPLKRSLTSKSFKSQSQHTNSKVKKIYNQFKGAKIDSMKKLSLERLAAYGLDKRNTKNKEK